MWKWAQGAVASVAGTTEPEYGKDAFIPVDDSVRDKNPYGVLERSDLTFMQPPQSHVETQVFYFHLPGGLYGFAQIIHSNPINVSFTTQFTCLILDDSRPDFKVWTSTRLEEANIDECDVHAEGFDVVLNKDASEYHVLSVVNEETQLDLRFKRVGLGAKIGKDGISKYGTDPDAPWGVMRHLVWPRCSVSGTVIVQGDLVELDGANGLFVMALQGMKPHHAASSWNFLNFQGPTTSCFVMEFRTPQSYGYGRSSIGVFTKDGELTATAIDVEIDHQDSAEDDVGWKPPKGIEFVLRGPKIGASDAEIDDPKNKVVVTINGKLEHQIDRVDVLAEIPALIKRVAAGVMGAKPYIYQYSNPMKLSVEIDGDKFEEMGSGYNEVTFISF